MPDTLLLIYYKYTIRSIFVHLSKVCDVYHVPTEVVVLKRTNDGYLDITIQHTYVWPWSGSSCSVLLLWKMLGLSMSLRSLTQHQFVRRSIPAKHKSTCSEIGIFPPYHLYSNKWLYFPPKTRKKFSIYSIVCCNTWKFEHSTNLSNTEMKM